MSLKTNQAKNSYQENKQQDLVNILGNFSQNINWPKIEWIWIKKSSRRKVTFQIDIKNNLGFFAEKSHNLLEVSDDESCEEKISEQISLFRNFLKTQEQNLFTQLTITSFDNGLDLIFRAKRKLNFTQEQNLIKFGQKNNFNISLLINKDFTPLFVSKPNQIFYPDFKINLSSNIFIQATKEGLESIIKIIRQNLSDKKLKIIDFYAGFGAYSFAIHDLVKSVLALEGDEKMANLISKNSRELNLGHKITSKTQDLFSDPMWSRELNNFEIAIINPPRNGAGTQIKQIAKSNLQKVIYVSCNPKSFLRDAKILIEKGFKVKNLHAIDQFYNTRHLELVATFTK